MRALLLIAGAALALSGCSRGGPSENNQAATESLAPQNIVSNDVTAIDAVTGDAANMAADVDMNFGNLNEVVGNAPASAPQHPARPISNTPAREVSNTAVNASTNATATTNAQ